MHEMDRSNAQALEIKGGKAFKLQPLAEEQLDTMYTALARTAATFESGSAGEKTFRDEALRAINDFHDDNVSDTMDKFTLLMTAKGGRQVPSATVFSADAVITQKSDGGVEITSSESRHHSLNDWNDPDWKSRRRYGHLLKGH